ncbi:MAG: T9SS type A sorting domain-containing protein [Bacteroidetes bacterium]|nr:T9SS type A sorting domain-containing protein [Bacteroidota bacterium]
MITSIAQSPADTLTLYAASFRNIFVTHDKGISWNNITAGLPADSASITDVKTADNNSNTAYVTFSGFYAGEKIYQTTDAGLTWTNISGTLPNVPFNTIVIQNNSNNDMYAGCDFGVFFKNDTMTDWVDFNSNLPGVIVSDLDINYRSSKLYTATHGRGIFSVDLVTPVAPIANDAAIAQITSPEPKDYCDSLTTPLTLKIKNFGSDTLYTATINYAIDNGVLQSVAWAGSLAPSQTVLDTVATITLYGGNHYINAFTSNPNSATDAYPLNDAASININVGTAIAAFPFIEGFETGIFPPVDWSTSSNGSLWSQDTTVGAYSNSTHSAVADFYNVQSGIDYLSAMRIDLTNATATPFLVFSHAYAMFDATYLDTLIISASGNCGDTWDILYSKSAQDLVTVANFVTTPFVPAANEWVTTYIDLTAYMGQYVKIRFEAHSGYSNLLYIDDINILHGTVGLTENDRSNINVFPNPTNGTFNVSDPDNLVQNIQVFDSNGKLIYNKSSKQIHEPIDMSSFQQSLYFIKMQTVKGMVTKKVSLMK